MKDELYMVALNDVVFLKWEWERTYNFGLMKYGCKCNVDMTEFPSEMTLSSDKKEVEELANKYGATVCEVKFIPVYDGGHK